jgi:hypothetical protein
LRELVINGRAGGGVDQKPGLLADVKKCTVGLAFDPEERPPVGRTVAVADQKYPADQGVWVG